MFTKIFITEFYMIFFNELNNGATSSGATSFLENKVNYKIVLF